MREACAVFSLAGQLVRLRIVQVLQAVFDLAKENVGFSEFRRRGLRQESFLRQQIQNQERRPRGELRIAPAAHQLQRLRDELDLTDAAGTELDVLRQLAARHVAPHFGVQPAHGVEGAIVEVLAVDERPHDFL